MSTRLAGTSVGSDPRDTLFGRHTEWQRAMRQHQFAKIPDIESRAKRDFRLVPALALPDEAVAALDRIGGRMISSTREACVNPKRIDLATRMKANPG